MLGRPVSLSEPIFFKRLIGGTAERYIDNRTIKVQGRPMDFNISECDAISGSVLQLTFKK